MSDYKAYPRRLYLNGQVLEDDPHASNSVVVQDAAQESAARAKGYRKAWEGIPVKKRVLTPKKQAATLSDEAEGSEQDKPEQKEDERPEDDRQEKDLE